MNKKVLTISTTAFAALLLAGCSSNTQNTKSDSNSTAKTTQQKKKPAKAALKKPDFPNAKSAETALNKGDELKGKTVQFKIKKLEPQSAYGYNMETGKHLNFVDPENPDAKKGDTVYLKIKKVKSVLGSFVITYTNLHKINK